MPLYLNIWNASLEPRDIMINSKMFHFKARGLGKIPEDYLPCISATEYRKMGLIHINYDDDFKAKDREALINYLGFLNEREQYHQWRLDQAQRNGVTIKPPRDLEVIRQWRQEIIEKLEMDAPLHEVPSFKTFKSDDENNLFAGEPEIKEIRESKTGEVEEVVNGVVKKRGRPSSFRDTDIMKELQK